MADYLKKFIILTVSYYIPVVFLPLYLTGLKYPNHFYSIILICASVALAIVLVAPILEFTTLKKNIFTQILIGAILTYALLYLLHLYFNAFSINAGLITLAPLDVIKNASFSASAIVIGAISSLLFSIWGIIVSNLT